jgi:hypothetical protein
MRAGQLTWGIGNPRKHNADARVGPMAPDDARRAGKDLAGIGRRRSVHRLPFGVCIRRPEVELHRLSQEHLQAQTVTFRSNLEISAQIIRNGN